MITILLRLIQLIEILIHLAQLPQDCLVTEVRSQTIYTSWFYGRDIYLNYRPRVGIILDPRVRIVGSIICSFILNIDVIVLASRYCSQP